MTSRQNHWYRIARRCAAILVAGLLMFTAGTTLAARAVVKTAAPRISATAAPACVAAPGTANISLATVSISAGTGNGLIGQPSSPVSVTFSCTGTNFVDAFDILTGNLAALDTSNSPPGGSGILFTSTVPGIDILLTATPNQASSGNNGPNGTRGWQLGQVNCFFLFGCYNTVTATFTAQLVKIGPIAPGTTNTVSLLQFFDSNANFSGPSSSFGTLVLNPVKVNVSSCTVSTQSQNFTVMLPTVSVSALSGAGQVGTTPFNIQYSCSGGSSLFLTMNTSTPGAAAGVILPPASCSAGPPAANVAVRLLQSDGHTAVNFGVAQPLGNSPNGTLTIPYYAQYYATGSPVGAGAACATATFTMSYN